jgi:hypothetical protein
LGVGRKTDNLVAVAKSKEVKTGWFNSRRNRQVWQNFRREAMAQKRALLPMMMMMMSQGVPLFSF